MSEKMKDARRARAGETIAGGYFVFRRGERTNRIRPSNFPFEHSDLTAATCEADRLSRLQPGFQFDVLQVVASVTTPKQEAEAA